MSSQSLRSAHEYWRRGRPRLPLRHRRGRYVDLQVGHELLVGIQMLGWVDGAVHCKGKVVLCLHGMPVSCAWMGVSVGATRKPAVARCGVTTCLEPRQRAWSDGRRRVCFVGHVSCAVVTRICDMCCSAVRALVRHGASEGGRPRIASRVSVTPAVCPSRESLCDFISRMF